MEILLVVVVAVTSLTEKYHHGVNIQTATNATMQQSLDIHARAGITFVASGTRRLSSVSESRPERARPTIDG